MPFATWNDVGDALVVALGRLSDGEFLILGEPTADPLPKRGLFGRRARPTPARYVQVLRYDDLYTAECVGQVSQGGTWEMNEPTIAQLRQLGWRSPDEEERDLESITPNFDMYVALNAAPTLSELLVESLRCLGASPEDLTLQASG
jgi:hypothetical protein